MTRPVFAALPACALGVAILTACHWGEKEAYIIPPKETAEQQYFFAVQHRQNLMKIPTRDRERQYRSIIEAYEAVPKRFPDDQVHTPLARLDIADCHFELKHYSEALKLYKAAQKDYAANDFVQARSLLEQGRCYEALKNNRKAVECYKQCADQYSGHPNEVIQKVVASAKALSDRILPVSPK